MSTSFEAPTWYRTVMPYLILENAEGFLQFAREVFGAEEKSKHLDDQGHVNHAEIVIGDSTIMIGQSNENWPPQTAGLYINVESADESYQKSVDAGASTVMELSDQFYGRTCGVMDQTGNTWWITSPPRA